MATIKEEIATLKKAMGQGGFRYLRWESLTKRLEAANFPYTLEQTFDPDPKTRFVNLYYWTDKKGANGNIYVFETEAGKVRVNGVRNACDALIKALKQFAY